MLGRLLSFGTMGRSLLGRAGLVTGAEMVNRVTRIVTAIALARSMDVAEFGIAMAALTVHELVRMFIQNGLGTRIVAANDEDVNSVAMAVHRLNWRLAGVLCICQIAVAVPIANHFGAPELGYAIALLAVVHMIYPWSMVQVYLAQRDDRWTLVSFAIAAQAGIDNLLTAALAVLGFGIWAVVLPKLVVACLWVVWHRTKTPWKHDVSTSVAYKGLLAYSSKVLGAEVLATLRAHGDKAVVGAVLGPTALGLYAFASNIGRGMTLSLSQGLGAVILPHLRRSRDSGTLIRGHLETVIIMMLAIAPLAVLLAVSADWLVPILFGAKWQPAAGLVTILALASISHPLIVATSQMLRADDRAGEDLVIAFLITAMFFAALVGALPYGLMAAVVAMSVAQVCVAVVVILVSFARLKRTDQGDLDLDGVVL